MEFKVELYLNEKQIANYGYTKPVTVKDVVTRQGLANLDTIAFKIDNEFVNSQKIIVEDKKLECVSYETEEGYRIYQDTAIFIMAKAFHRLFHPLMNVIIKHSIGDGIYCEVVGKDKIEEDEISELKKEMQNIVAQHLCIEKQEVPLDDAIKIFKEQEREDVLTNLRYNHSGYTYLFKCGSYYDYYIRQLCDSTATLTEFELNYTTPGFCIRFPLITTKKIQPLFSYPKKLFAIHQEADKWLDILGVHYIGELNEVIEKLEINNDIQVEEALHEKKIAGFADYICKERDIRAVTIAGPSSSGKTTFARRLAVQLQVNGIKPIIIGLDEYFHPRHKTPRKENGDYDFESILSLDLEYFNEHLKKLKDGKEVILPKYNFVSGLREHSATSIKMEKNNVLLIEGIHGLNEQLTEAIPAQYKKKIYISCLNQLNLDRHNRIATTYFRKIRRIVRDRYFRGYSAEVTLSRWQAISEGEQLNIFPFQENADLIFNSGLTYEVNVLKKHALPALHRISKYSPMYTEAQKLIHIVEHALDIPDDLVPTNSILREFIGGGVFKY